MYKNVLTPARRCKKSDLKRIAKATGAHFITSLANVEGEESFEAAFLGEAEKHGKDIKVSFADGTKHQSRTIASEARTLKKMFMKLRD